MTSYNTAVVNDPGWIKIETHTHYSAHTHIHTHTHTNTHTLYCALSTNHIAQSLLLCTYYILCTDYFTIGAQ